MGAPTDREMPLWRQWREVFAKINADHVLNHFKIRTPPIPVLEIVTAAGITVGEFSDEDNHFSGVVDLLEDQAYIGIKKSDPPGRKRFTLAHELGHIVLHKHAMKFRDAQDQPFTHEEVQANMFAAELLMPAWMVWVLPRPERTPDLLSARFQVSIAAAKQRLRHLGGDQFGR